MTERLGLIVNKLIVTEVFDHRVQFDFEPVLKHLEVSIRRPCRFIGVPPVKLSFEDFTKYVFKNTLRLVIVLISRNQVNSLFALDLGDETGVIQLCGPIKKRLLRAHDQHCAIQHVLAIGERPNEPR